MKQMRLGRVRRLACLGASWVLFAFWAPAANSAPACELEKIQLIVADERDAADVCLGAAQALAFFAGHGLNLHETVKLEVMKKLPKGISSSAAGVYLAESNQIYMLSYGAFRKFGNWFNTPISREVYQSLAAHELAHAITNAHFRFTQPSVHAREYLAYVGLFATMAPALRERILKALPGQTYEDDSRLSLMVYLMDPMFFGAQSYRHYLNLKQDQRDAYISAVLAGRTLTD